ncbi:hypothetical protein LEP1GSC108_3640 [Leptospira weilii str. UI 13098]|uniref:Uncharacterized protein n=1 Tax=Leptospira weilii str. UI 13098 TaxID=1088542 RepID=M6Q8N3_9LEPT|nr:hypothetical protein LEP1GSC108_3640 [Leptospira weilii str. UI 13098]
MPLIAAERIFRSSLEMDFPKTSEENNMIKNRSQNSLYFESVIL